jgi:hypothetical protein
MSELYKKGLSTEDALFTIASEMVEAQAVESLQSLNGTKFFRKAVGHEIHVHVKSNGEITYKCHSKSD